MLGLDPGKKRSFAIVLLIASLSSSSGCGGGNEVDTKRELPVGPHGGAAIELPGARGYVELVNIAEDDGSMSNARYVAYFIDPDMSSTLSSLPSSVVVEALTPDQESLTIPLMLNPEPDDPLGDGRFRSEVGPYATDQMIGELVAEFDGQEYRLRYSFR